MHPDTAKDHWPAKKCAGLVIVEDNDDGGGCSWCPVVEDGRDENKDRSHANWVKGEQQRAAGDWHRALDTFTRGVVADPLSVRCWIGLSRVSYGWIGS